MPKAKISKCLVKECPGDAKMFKVPSDPAAYALWLKILEREDLIGIRARLQVCKKHFRPEMFSSVRLRRTAIPFLEEKEKKDLKFNASSTVQNFLAKASPSVRIANRIGDVQIQRGQIAGNNSHSILTKDCIDHINDIKKCGEILVGPQGTLTLVCAMCAERFVNLESFGMHIQSQHTQTDPIPVQLPQLGALNADVGHPISHNLIKIPPTKPSHSSREVDKQVQSQTNKRKEPSEITAANTKTIVCKFYDKSVTDVFKYIEHLKTHSGPVEFTCPLCPMKFHSPSGQPLRNQVKKKYRCST